MRPALLGLLLLPGCDAVLTGAGPDGSGTDQALVADCLRCHQASVGAAWRQPSTHSLLFDCSQCHATLKGEPGEGHVTTRRCEECHSERLHHAASCGACHDVHGSANRFLVRERLSGARVQLDSLDGVGPGGLARGYAGSGVCEVCHTATASYRADGTGAAHDGAWCVGCHSHQRGFAAQTP